MNEIQFAKEYCLSIGKAPIKKPYGSYTTICWRLVRYPLSKRDDIQSKGLYLIGQGKKKIHIKQSLPIREKLKVLLHEYSHYVHLTHYFNQESRAECKIIANGSASLVCWEYKLNIVKDVELTKFNDDLGIIARLTATIQSVAEHIITDLNQGQEQRPC